MTNLAPIVIPEMPGNPGKLTRRMHYHIDRFLLHLSPILRWAFHLGALVFDLAPILMSKTHRPFTRSTAAQQQAWVRRADRSRLMPLYRWFYVIRGLILLVYYSQEETHTRLGYAPADWAKQKILQRRRRLNLMEEPAHDPQRTEYQTKSH